MGNSKVEYSYFNGMTPINKQQQCRNLLKTKYDTVTINGVQWQQYQIKKVLKLIDQWNVKRTFFVRDVRVFPLQVIEDIKFPFLMNLSLQNNSIQTIEQLCRIWLPSIQVIDLSRNQLRSIGGLRKLIMKRIKRIYLHDNPFQQSESLSQINNTIQQISISSQISINWSIKTQINFSDFTKENQNNLLRSYNFSKDRVSFTFALMINI